MKISLVTLNFNSSEKTLELLNSLKNQTDSDFEIVIVDNASEEADFAKLKNFIHTTTCDVVSSQLQLIRNNENLGFSGGNNIGIHRALKNGSGWIILLNNDTWVERNFIERLKAILSAKTGIVGIPLIEGGQVAYCGKIQWLKPTLIHTTTCDVVSSQIYAVGGAMAIHKNVFEKIGLLDKKYFLYFEDVDFSVRARKAGFDISVIDSLSVHHHVSSSTKKLGSSLLLRYHYRNALYFNFKNGSWYIKIAAWLWSWLIIAKQIIKIIVGKNREQSLAILKGATDWYANKMGKLHD